MLELCRVPDCSDVYVLGSFARYVTIYGQQVRALNLVHALAASGHINSSSRVAIVGAGISGMTAAVSLIRRGLPRENVVLYDRHGGAMRLQMSSKRYVHPHIYDWPDPAALNTSSGLPEPFAWDAGRADEVFAKLLTKWEPFTGKPHPTMPKLKVGRASTSSMIDNGEGAKQFDAIVLAIGFGDDGDETSHTIPYWADDPLDHPNWDKKRWLVSGAGDGALTDLLRLCIQDFRHDKIVAAATQTSKKLMEELAETQWRSATIEDFRERGRLLSRALNNQFQRRNDEPLLLNASPEEVYGPGSAVLNRLLIAWAEQDRRFKFREPAERVVGVSHAGLSGRKTVKFTSGEMEFDDVVLRHGPKRSASNPKMLAIWDPYVEIWERTAALRSAWEPIQNDPFADWTCKPIFDDHKVFADPPSVPLWPTSDQAGCVVVSAGLPKEHNLRNGIKTAMRGLKTRGALDNAPSVLHVDALEALDQPAAYERLVHALCISKLAIFDLTDLSRPILLFLGIRAAVAAGVTVCVQRNGPSQKLPFNLLGLNPIYWENQKDAPSLAQAFEDGIAASKSAPHHYLDLPAYHAVRRFAADGLLVRPEIEILHLCSFTPRLEESTSPVRSAAETIFNPQEGVRRTLDSKSPQLVEQRLYAGLRKAELCIADWTGWSPNVIFETGVRLAANVLDPIIVISRDLIEGKENWPADSVGSAALKNFFVPTEYSTSDTTAITQLLESFRDAVTPAQIGRKRTFEIIERSIRSSANRNVASVPRVLMDDAASLMVGNTTDGRIVALHIEPDVARRAAIERYLAAWFYLDQRHGLLTKVDAGVAITDERSHLQEMIKIGEWLESELKALSGYDSIWLVVSQAMIKLKAAKGSS